MISGLLEKLNKTNQLPRIKAYYHEIDGGFAGRCHGAVHTGEGIIDCASDKTTENERSEKFIHPTSLNLVGIGRRPPT